MISAVIVEAWLDWSDELKEGQFTSLYNSSKKMMPADYQGWGSGEPNGDRLENCVDIRQQSSSNKWNWNDIACSKLFCVLCQISSLPVFHLRGNTYSCYFGAKIKDQIKMTGGFLFPDKLWVRTPPRVLCQLLLGKKRKNVPLNFPWEIILIIDYAL